LLAKLWPAVGADFARALCGQAEPLAAARIHPLGYPLRRVALHWSAPPPPEPMPWQVREPAAEERDTAVEFSWVGETARHVGTVTHLFLQRMARDGLEAWSLARIDRLGEALRLALKQQGVAASELEAAQARVRQALASVLEDPRARWLLSAEHTEARSEHRVSGELDGALVHVALDRTFVDREGVRWIVDYKTGVHQGGDLDAFLDRERERYRDQLERYAALIARTESRPIRLGLYFPLLRGWREWRIGAAGEQG
jgi:hypothetical protein